MTLLDLLDQAPDEAIAIALPEEGIQLSYRELSLRVRNMAETLAGAGIGREDRVAIALRNGLPAVVSILAASTVGTAAPLNPMYRREEFEFYLGDTGAKMLILPSEGAEEAQAAADNRIPVLKIAMSKDGQVDLDVTDPPAVISKASADDIALVLHTSGSTGRPKRVPLRHRNLTVSAEHIVDSYALVSRDVSLCVMPLFHIHGLVASTLATFRSAGTVVMPTRFNPLSFWRTVRSHGVTWYSAVPTIHQLLLARAESSPERPEGANGLRFIRSCSAPLSPNILERLEENLGTPVLEAYGMTEASHQMSSNPLPPGERKPGSVGTGTGVEINIVGDTGETKAVGEVGEIVIRGPNVIDGYENNLEANRSSFFGDWFRTGDQGRVDSDGYLALTGRLKELINRGGEKISPREVDEVILQHPAVSEAVAFGVPHKSWGEEVEAAVVVEGTETTEADLIEHCNQKLAYFKTPKKVHIVDVIPKTATGKIQRRVVAAQFIEKKG